MQVKYDSDFPVTDAACKKSTGKTLKQWFKTLEAQGEISTKRRDAVNWLYAEMGKDLWWCTTAWVEYERANGVVKKDGLAEGYNICVTKTISAPVSDVYTAWSEGSQLGKWFAANSKVKVVDKGEFDDGYGNSGEFLRIRPDKDLRFTWRNSDAESETRVDVAFADKGKGRTGITLNHQRLQNRREADGLRRAWASAFNDLKTLLES